MTRIDLFKGVKAKHSDLAAMNYRKKFDLIDLDYKLKELIDYLEAYMNTQKADGDFINIRNAFVDLKNEIVVIHDREKLRRNEECRELFNEVKHKSVGKIEELLNSIHPF